MAEAVGLTASCLQLVEVALKTTKAINDFAKAIKRAPQRVEGFNKDVERANQLLKLVKTNLKKAEDEGYDVERIANEMERTLEKFNKDMEIMEKEVKKVYQNSKGWRAKFRVGIRGESDWNAIEKTLNDNYQKINTLSTTLSNATTVENGKLIKGVGRCVQAVSFQIDRNVSAPLRDLGNDVQDVRDTGDKTLWLLQQNINLQAIHMKQSLALEDRIVTSHSQTISRLDSIDQRQAVNNTDISKIEQGYVKLAGRVQGMEEALKNKEIEEGVVRAQAQAVMADLIALQSLEKHPTNTSIPRTRNERIKLEQQKRALLGALRRIQKLAEGSPTKILKNEEAGDYLSDIQQLLNVLLDEESGENGLRDELSELTSQLLASSKAPVYVQAAPDRKITKYMTKAEARNQHGPTPSTPYDLEKGEILKEATVETGKVFLFSQKEKVTELDSDGDEEEVEVTRTTVEFRPNLWQGESKPGWSLVTSRSSGTYGTSFVPPLIRVYNRRFDEYSGNENNPFMLATKGNLEGLQRLLSAGQLWKFDKMSGTAEINSVILAFKKVLDSALAKTWSPFRSESALSGMIRGLSSGIPLFFEILLSKIEDTEFDMNNYHGGYNAVIPDIISRPNALLNPRICEIAKEHGADVDAQTWETGESGLHLTLIQLQLGMKDLEDIEDRFRIRDEEKWIDFRNYAQREVALKIDMLLGLGANIYATDNLELKFNGRNINRSVTRAMYIWELQSTWWDKLASHGYSKTDVLEGESQALGINCAEYEAFLDSLPLEGIAKRKSIFERCANQLEQKKLEAVILQNRRRVVEILEEEEVTNNVRREAAPEKSISGGSLIPIINMEQEVAIFEADAIIV
ncbi:hypothetical protein ABW19_dt0206185 [Dactylella cylindrospora]|nr:hypothetical protein ABW19_dt0206185 [Dactylella cylindrospora]